MSPATLAKSSGTTIHLCLSISAIAIQKKRKSCYRIPLYVISADAYGKPLEKLLPTLLTPT
jgi:hypothetical protein